MIIADLSEIPLTIPNYLISSHWFTSLLQYLETEQYHPGIIDTKSVLNGKSNPHNYEQINENLWKYLISWYGTPEIILMVGQDGKVEIDEADLKVHEYAEWEGE